HPGGGSQSRVREAGVAPALVPADVYVRADLAVTVAVDDGVGDVLESRERAPCPADDLAGVAAVDLDEHLVLGGGVHLDGVSGVDVEQKVHEERLRPLDGVTLDRKSTRLNS